MGGNTRLLHQVIEFYREDSPGIMERLRIPVAERDRQGMQLAAHSLRGLVVNFDAEAAALAARRIERLGQGDDLADADAMLDELECELTRLSEALTLEMADE